jgi:hypothetical protein
MSGSGKGIETMPGDDGSVVNANNQSEDMKVRFTMCLASSGTVGYYKPLLGKLLCCAIINVVST